MKDNTPYQQYLDRKYFDVIKVPKKTVYGEMYFPTTVVTGKGQIWLLNKLKEEYVNSGKYVYRKRGNAKWKNTRF